MSIWKQVQKVREKHAYAFWIRQKILLVTSTSTPIVSTSTKDNMPADRTLKTIPALAFVADKWAYSIYVINHKRAIVSGFSLATSVDSGTFSKAAVCERITTISCCAPVTDDVLWCRDEHVHRHLHQQPCPHRHHGLGYINRTSIYW